MLKHLLKASSRAGRMTFKDQFFAVNRASVFTVNSRYYANEPPPLQEHFDTKEEEAVYKKLAEALNPKQLAVHDISGGCGSMYNIVIKSDKFNSLTTIKQHKLVNSILKEEIAKWHGLQLSTRKDK
ncbi:hypothetical protein C6P45_000283 [Maudiozyma exigua]|uniref:Altered inheritance of mitochondria protein 1 n=1 Tax=Maudiozyma exigua TaxID=34358 RepID=A0A9P6W8U7_MAUEX|nr:hypothetical protein C6P45_000283 [Kazachstania exigua]